MKGLLMTKQSVMESVKESLANTGFGFALSWLTVFLCITFINPPALAATVSCILCTLWSFIRSFIIRRYFNNRQEKQNVTNANVSQ